MESITGTGKEKSYSNLSRWEDQLRKMFQNRRKVILIEDEQLQIQADLYYIALSSMPELSYRMAHIILNNFAEESSLKRNILTTE